MASESPDEAATRTATSVRKRLVIVIATVVGLLLAVLVGLLIARGGGQREPITVETVTVAAVSPSPVTEPIERDTPTALLAALPGTVLGYAVSEQVESEQMLAAYALEGWTLTYSDPDAVIVLDAGQWPDEREATAAWDALVADAQPIASGEVVVGGEPAGDVVTAVEGETERTIWRNRSAVFVAQGPVGTTQSFFDGFPY